MSDIQLVDDAFVANGKGQIGVVYQLNKPPGTLYTWNGSKLASTSSSTVAGSPFVDLASLNAAFPSPAAGLTAVAGGVAYTASGGVWVAPGAGITANALALLQAVANSGPYPVEKLMGSPPTITSGTAATLARVWKANPARSNSYLSAGGTFFTLCGAGNFIPYFSEGGLYSQNISSISGNVPDRGGSFKVCFNHYGTSLEIIMPGTNGGLGIGLASQFRVKVNDEYANLTVTSVAGDSNTYYYKYAFGSVAMRRIDIIISSGLFGGVVTAATDSITPAKIRGPRTIVAGDSFVFGAAGNNGSVDNFAQVFSDAMRWDDVWSSGVGGTGYANGSTGNLINRLANDVLAWSPQVIIDAMGRNDNATDPATVGAAAAACFALAKNDVRTKDSIYVKYGPLWNSGPNGYATGLIAVRDAIKTAAVAAGCLYIDALERPLPDRTYRLAGSAPFSSGLSGITNVPATGTLSGAVSIGASTFSLSTGALPWPCMVKIDTETVYVKAGTFGSDSYTIDGTFKAVHASAAVVTQIGEGVFIGSGRVGAASGFGNADIFCYSDGVHPTSAGQLALGVELASRFVTALSVGKTSGVV